MVRWLSVALVLLATVGSLTLFAEGLGLTYDEPVYAAVGERHLGWYTGVLTGQFSPFDRAALDRHWRNSGSTPVEADWHPPVGKVWLALCRRLPSPGVFAGYRLGNVLWFAFTTGLLCWFIGHEAGAVAGLAAGLAWLTMPRAVAHGNLAALDMPVAFFSLVAVWVVWRGSAQVAGAGASTSPPSPLSAGGEGESKEHRSAPTPPLRGRRGGRGVRWPFARPATRLALLFGLTLALAVSSKFNGVLVCPAVVLWAAMVRRRAVAPLLVGAAVVAPLVGWLLWPWLWYDGWAHLRAVVAFHGRHSLIATEYCGRVWTDPPPPWHYPPVMLAITTPLLTLASAAAAGRRADGLTRLLGLVLLWHILPFMQPGAAKYNGVRLFLPALPALAALSGLGTARLAAALAARVPATSRRTVPLAVIAGVYLPALVGLLQVYPYPMAYYNALVGGAVGADRRGFETSYWGDPFREAVRQVSRVAPPGAAVYLHPPGAIAMVEMYRGTGQLRGDLRLVHGAAGLRSARYFVYQNRRSEWDDLAFRLREQQTPAMVVDASGAAVAYIWERRAPWPWLEP